jgi:hypothetical protein
MKAERHSLTLLTRKALSLCNMANFSAKWEARIPTYRQIAPAQIPVVILRRREESGIISRLLSFWNSVKASVLLLSPIDDRVQLRHRV